MSLWMVALHITIHTVGLHAAGLLTHLALMTAGASLNHAGYDCEIRFLGWLAGWLVCLGAQPVASINLTWTGVDWYSTGAHEMHHRRPDKNFGQFTMLWEPRMHFLGFCCLVASVFYCCRSARDEDKLMGTYIPYLHDEGAESSKGTREQKTD